MSENLDRYAVLIEATKPDVLLVMDESRPMGSRSTYFRVSVLKALDHHPAIVSKESFEQDATPYWDFLCKHGVDLYSIVEGKVDLSVYNEIYETLEKTVPIYLPELHMSRTSTNRHDVKKFCEIPQKICCRGLDIWVAKLVEAENEAIPVEAENRTWYNPLKGYGLLHSPFLLRRNNHGTKEQKAPNS